MGDRRKNILIYVLREGRDDAAVWLGLVLNFDKQINSIRCQLFRNGLSKKRKRSGYKR